MVSAFKIKWKPIILHLKNISRCTRVLLLVFMLKLMWINMSCIVNQPLFWFVICYCYWINHFRFSYNLLHITLPHHFFYLWRHKLYIVYSRFIVFNLGVVNNGKYSKNQYHPIHTCLLQSNAIDPDYFSVSLPAIYLSLSPFRSTDYFLNMQMQIYLSFHLSSLCNLFSSVLNCDICSTVQISIHPLDHKMFLPRWKLWTDRALSFLVYLSVSVSIRPLLFSRLLFVLWKFPFCPLSLKGFDFFFYIFVYCSTARGWRIC